MIPCGDMHQSFTDTLVKSFFDNFPMFADSFCVLSIHCITRGLGASFLFKCPASRGGSLAIPATARPSCYLTGIVLHCFNTVRWASGRVLSNEVLALVSVWSEVQMVCNCIWPSWCNCHPTISWFIEIHIGLTFLMPVYPVFPGKEANNWVSAWHSFP